MQRGVESHWPAVRGTRFVAPVRSAPGRPLLSRAIVRITPCSTRAALDAAQREPLAAVRRSARSLVVVRPALRRGVARRLPGGSSMRMSATRTAEGSEPLAGLAQRRRLTAPTKGSPRPPDPPPWSG